MDLEERRRLRRLLYHNLDEYRAARRKVTLNAMRALVRRADELTAKYPPRTLCRYWLTADRSGPAGESRLQSPYTVRDGEIVVCVAGVGLLRADAVEPSEPNTEGHAHGWTVLDSAP